MKKLPAGQPVRKKAKHSVEITRNLPQMYEFAGTEPQYSFIESTQFRQEHAYINEMDEYTQHPMLPYSAVKVNESISKDAKQGSARVNKGQHKDFLNV